LGLTIAILLEHQNRDGRIEQKNSSIALIMYFITMSIIQQLLRDTLKHTIKRWLPTGNGNFTTRKGNRPKELPMKGTKLL
jgi:hypothetical protein